METDIQVTRDGAVGVITMARRHRYGSLDVASTRDLRRVALRLARDVDVRCIVLRGQGGIFCTGVDLKAIRAGTEDAALDYLHPTPRATGRYGARFKEMLEYLHCTISELRRTPKPVIAAVDGMAAAGGFGLALACDLVVASQRALFEYAYFKTALTGAESTTFFLPQILGLRRALELALLNRRVSAPEALQLGLASRVVPTERFEDEVAILARELAAGPTASYGAAKRLMNDSAAGYRLDRHLDRELEELVFAADGQDFAEGLSAFFEKRPARFTGQPGGV